LAPYGRVAAGGAKAAARLSGPLRPLNAIAGQAYGILGDIDGDTDGLEAAGRL
jgi:hypothetical protein